MANQNMQVLISDPIAAVLSFGSLTEWLGHVIGVFVDYEYESWTKDDILKREFIITDPQTRAAV